jgi:hypothetical protein
VTCIVGIKTAGGVLLAGDALASGGGQTTVRADFSYVETRG